MFGKIRASSCPAERLERPPSKILKDDSLSIYEATLMKLKLGSKRNLSPCSNEAGKIDTDSSSSSPASEPMTVEVECASSGASAGCVGAASSSGEEFMAIDTDWSSLGSTSSGDSSSKSTSKQQRSTHVSVLYLFSKFKKAQDEIIASAADAMTTENVSSSMSSSGCGGSLNNTEHEFKQQCINSLPASHTCML